MIIAAAYFCHRERWIEEMKKPKEDLVEAFSKGEISRQVAMIELDVSYSELLALLETKKLPLPKVPDEVADEMGTVMNMVLDGKKP